MLSILYPLILVRLTASEGSLADSVDQDQTAQNVQSDLRSTLSDKEIVLPQINSKLQYICILL